MVTAQFGEPHWIGTEDEFTLRDALLLYTVRRRRAQIDWIHCESVLVKALLKGAEHAYFT